VESVKRHRGNTNMNTGAEFGIVLGLRFFVCDACETVYADVEKPPLCSNCDVDSIQEIKAEMQAASYFSCR